MVDDWSDKIPKGTFEPWFLLSQDAEILDVSSKPSSLLWCLIEVDKDFSILIGTINEFGKHEIIGACGEYFHIEGGNTWMVTSPMDGYDRRVGITGTPASFIKSRLTTMHHNKKFDNLLNYPQVTLRGYVE